MSSKAASARNFRDLLAFGWLGLGILTLLSLLSYSPSDLSFYSTHPTSGNFVGPIGANWAFALFFGAGLGAYVVPLMFFYAALIPYVFDDISWPTKACWGAVLVVCVAGLMQVQHQFGLNWVTKMNVVGTGGLLGIAIAEYALIPLVGSMGTQVVLSILGCVTGIMFLDLQPRQMVRDVITAQRARAKRLKMEMLERANPEERLHIQKEELLRQQKDLEKALTRHGISPEEILAKARAERTAMGIDPIAESRQVRRAALAAKADALAQELQREAARNAAPAPVTTAAQAVAAAPAPSPAKPAPVVSYAVAQAEPAPVTKSIAPIDKGGMTEQEYYIRYGQYGVEPLEVERPAETETPENLNGNAGWVDYSELAQTEVEEEEEEEEAETRDTVEMWEPQDEEADENIDEQPEAQAESEAEYDDEEELAHEEPAAAPEPEEKAPEEPKSSSIFNLFDGGGSAADVFKSLADGKAAARPPISKPHAPAPGTVLSSGISRETMPFPLPANIKKPTNYGIPDNQISFPSQVPVAPEKHIPLEAAAKAKSPEPSVAKQPEPETAKPVDPNAVPVYILPEIDALQTNKSERLIVNEIELQANAQLLVDTLKQFGVETTAGPITYGATITRYELQPARGVRVDKIVSLKRDLARAMHAEKLNILAPIPGKGTVGVEVANTHKVPIVLRELLESPEWLKSNARIPLAMGKDVYGRVLIADLGEMPHMLVAGTTGSGKSVCINCILLSLLYRFSPEELRLILIDPKQVEMQVYNSIPHLVVPVVTDPKKVVTALRWVINEMERRYQILAKTGVRNISNFNNRPKKALAPKVVELQPELDLDGDGEPLETPAALPPLPDEPGEFSGENTDAVSTLAVVGSGSVKRRSTISVPRDEDLIIPDKLPYIVVIIDELADLMQTSGPDVESAIARLTAKARAAGIHLIVATQSPRREVVTGVIKTNIPSRVAFQVPSALDSRVILDESGAENLLGKGDFLYLPPGSARLVRGQGAFVSDEEVQQVVDVCAAQASHCFEPDIHQKLSPGENGGGDIDPDDAELICRCWDVICQEKRASTSMLQRRLRLGYNKAAWVVDWLEKAGALGPENGAKPREILVDLEDFILPL